MSYNWKEDQTLWDVIGPTAIDELEERGYAIILVDPEKAKEPGKQMAHDFAVKLSNLTRGLPRPKRDRILELFVKHLEASVDSFQRELERVKEWERAYRDIAAIFGFKISEEPEGLDDLVRHIEALKAES